LDDVVERIRIGAFYQSGQSCISVQRIVIHESIYDELKSRLVEDARNLKMVEPTLLESVPKDALLYTAEAFGPVAMLESFAEFDEALRIVNDSQYGLQAGLFVRDIMKIQKAWDELEVGGVIIGDVPSWRVDHMPYGGVKDSGIGREGIRFAVEEMTEIRLLAIRNAPPKPH
jgi:acyl-CoA reductase-like NAD-dependent aldehyde dehydrogenase